MRLNPFAGTYLTDPAASWRVLLGRPERVHFAEDLGMWLITKHADVRYALGDDEAFSNALTLMPVYEISPIAATTAPLPSRAPRSPDSTASGRRAPARTGRYRR